MPEVIIKLDEARDAKGFKNVEDLIHQRELEMIVKFINESLALQDEVSSSSIDADWKRMRQHDTITLAGGRGSGKTSLVLSLFRQLSKLREGKKGSIEILDIIDPTIIEQKGHIFLNIISLIKTKVSEKAEEKNCFSSEAGSPLNKEYEGWQESLRCLAAGLPTLDGIGPNPLCQEEWLDPEFAMEKGEQQVRGAMLLEKHFHLFVELSLKFLKKDAFLLCFDDIDTNFERGFPVLEVLRKYLTTQKIITILSGDLGLYSLEVRKNIWTNFGKTLLKTEYRHGTDEAKWDYHAHVTELEEQYFLKLLKPERRLILHTLIDKIEYEGYDIKIEGPGEAQRTSLQSRYQRFLDKFGVRSKRNADIYYRFLAGLPVRTQIQLLHQFTNKLQLSGNSDPENFAVGFADTLSDVFWAALTETGIDVPILRDHKEMIIIHSLKFLNDEGFLECAYQLRPETDNPIQNQACFAVAATISLFGINHPSVIFDYWLRIGLIREIAMRAARKQKDIDAQNIIEHCDIARQRTMLHIAGMVVSYLHALNAIGGQDAQAGIIPLKALAQTRKKSLPNRIDAILDRSGSLKRAIGYLPLSLAADHNGASTPIYSIFNLLGVIGEILGFLERCPEKELKETPEKVTPYLKAILNRPLMLQNYPLPAWTSAHGIPIAKLEEPEQADESELREQASIMESDILSEAIINWFITRNKLAIAPYLLGRIITRFFNNLESIGREIANAGAGMLMHRYVAALINAIIIEDVLENAPTEISNQLKPTNVVKSSRYLVDNLNTLNRLSENGKIDSFEKLAFSRWLCRMPVLIAFIGTSEETALMGALFNYTGKEFEQDAFNFIDSVNSSVLISMLNETELEVARKDDREQIDYNNSEHRKIFFSCFTDKEIDDILKLKGSAFKDRLNTNLAQRFLPIVGQKLKGAHKLLKSRRLS